MKFFPVASPTAGLLFTLATFGVGFVIRPLGALLFGVLGDRFGRKYTFLSTLLLMGFATLMIGLLPTYSQVGILAPVLLIIARVMQGLALGGEFGGAAIYVAEHAPNNRRGLYTSFIQAGVIGGFLLSVIAVAVTRATLAPAAWEAWGWRLPFILSLALLAASLWVRLKMHESPVFQQMQSSGTLASNPLRESFDSAAKIKNILVALFGVAAGLTVIWYTGQLQALYFLETTVGIDEYSTKVVIAAASLINVFWFLFFGWLSDHIGRKKPIVAGYALALVLIFPLFNLMADVGNPKLARAAQLSPAEVHGDGCTYAPFALRGQATPCARILDALVKRGVAYNVVSDSRPAAPELRLGGRVVSVKTLGDIDAALSAAGYPPARATITWLVGLKLVGILAIVGMLSGMTYGPATALLVEMFPARVRYTSLSIPYHLGTGIFGGFLPFISQYLAVTTGRPLAGLWYMLVVVAAALIISVFWLRDTRGVDLIEPD